MLTALLLAAHARRRTRLGKRTKRTRKGQRRNLKPRPPRRNRWPLEQYEDWDQHAHQLRERIMPNVVAVGDQVIVSDDGSGGGIIEQVLPRSSILARPDVFYGHRRQLV